MATVETGVAFKVLGCDGEPVNGGKGKWLLPKGGDPGKWMPKIKNVVPCESGYHLCERGQLVTWLGPTIWKAEWRGEVVRQDDKIVVGQARLIEQLTTWNERTQRLFACDCAEHVLHLYEKHYPDDSRVRNCIEIARKVANGDLPVSELAAARAAAGDAARAAAWAAARAAARAAAWDAARAAAWDAARAAAWAAAGDAEREWQTETLFRHLEA